MNVKCPLCNWEANRLYSYPGGMAAKYLCSWKPCKFLFDAFIGYDAYKTYDKKKYLESFNNGNK